MKFFPNFALRDLLMWLIALSVLLALALFLPYGPGLPGVEWELGQKADPLAPAFPGIKPEWYFLWIYQLLREFPPHLLGLEGSQLCLLLVSALLGIWALVPWLDRKARRGEYSPAFSDFGVGAILFITFLTLKAWDLGGGDGELPDPAAVARTCAWIMLPITAAATLLRVVAFGHRWFLLSAAVLLHALLNGLAGLSYLASGTIAAILAVLLIGYQHVRSSRVAASGGGAP
jgi:quinol-cytochrome oxidoreductase complex cytochrome b subunit